VKTEKKSHQKKTIAAETRLSQQEKGTPILALKDGKPSGRSENQYEIGSS